MGRTLKTTVAELAEWIDLQTRALIWAPVAAVGRPSAKQRMGRVFKDAWAPFEGIESLPRNKRCLIRAEDSKGGVHFMLSADDTGSAAIINPNEAVRIRRESELSRKEGLLSEREEKIKQYEDEMRNRDREHLADNRRTAAEHAKIGKMLDERSNQIAANLKLMEDVSRERTEQVSHLLEQLDSAMQRTHAAEEKNAMGASIIYASDKLLGTIQMWKIKGLADISPEMTLHIQQFIQQRSVRRYFDHLPDVAKKWCEGLFDMSPELRYQVMSQVTAALEEEKRTTSGLANIDQNRGR